MDTNNEIKGTTNGVPGITYDPSGKERNEIINDITDDFISDLSIDDFSSLEEMANTLESLINNALRRYDADVGKNGNKYRLIDGLPNDIIAELLAAVYPIKKIITYGDEEKDDNWVLGIYGEYGVKEGLYDTNESEIYKRARRFNRRITKHDFQEVVYVLALLVPCVKRCMEPDLIALNNGIFDYKKKVLLPFDEEKVFLAKKSY